MEKCISCGALLEDDDIYEVKGKIFCDTCAMGQHKVLQKCDPGAVRSALRDRQRSGFTGLDGLTDFQKEIYAFMKDQDGATMEQFVEKFKCAPETIDNELTVLRHLELGKGQKRADGVYFVIWEA
jgi:hypothetical protein